VKCKSNIDEIKMQSNMKINMFFFFEDKQTNVYVRISHEIASMIMEVNLVGERNSLDEI